MKNRLIFTLLFAICFEFLYSQNDSIKQAKKDSIRLEKNYYPFGSNKWYPLKGKNRLYTVPKDTIGRQTRLVPSLIAPAVLIGYGLTTIQNHGFYSSFKADKDIDRIFKNDQSNIDNFLIYSPYLEFATLLLLDVKNRDDFMNTTILILKSEILMSALVFPIKNITKEERPYSYELGENGVSLNDRKKDKQAFQSMPSGHTAQAFLAATIVYREYRHESVWYGVGAYALASTVGLYRMINDKHWESDVFVGAGIGILSANLAYAFHEHRWGRHVVVFIPTFDGINKGFSLSYNFNKENNKSINNYIK